MIMDFLRSEALDIVVARYDHVVGDAADTYCLAMDLLGAIILNFLLFS